MEQDSRLILVYGAGGHAKVVLDCATRLGWRSLLVDDDPTLVGETRLDSTVHLASQILAERIAMDVDGFVIAIGDNRVRTDKTITLRAMGIEPVTMIHPRAIIAESAEIGSGAQVMAGAIVNPDARVGENAILNTACVIEHDCIIGECAHIAPNATLGGGARIGRETLIGLGAIILPGVHVGANVCVGAGAVVVNDMPDGVIAMGVPAQIRRK